MPITCKVGQGRLSFMTALLAKSPFCPSNGEVEPACVAARAPRALLISMLQQNSAFVTRIYTAEFQLWLKRRCIIVIISKPPLQAQLVQNSLWRQPVTHRAVK